MSQLVEKKFSNRIQSYHNHAAVQKESAVRLANSLEPWRMILPEGPVLELGAGTGFFTNRLKELLPGRNLIISDISRGMLDYCSEKLVSSSADENRFRFQSLDAEMFRPGEQRFAMVCGNFVAQWFRDPALTLGRFAEALEPGGLLLTAFPGHESFPEWREKCLELGLPFTGNELPNTEEMVIKLSAGKGQVDFFEDSKTMEYPDAISFFQNLKLTGATTKFHDKQLSPEKFRLLLKHWDSSVEGPARVTWHLVFLVFKRDL